MSSDAATLSSTASALDDLNRRVTEIAQRYVDTEREEVAHGLFEVERNLLVATRRLQAVITALGGV